MSFPQTSGSKRINSSMEFEKKLVCRVGREKVKAWEREGERGVAPGGGRCSQGGTREKRGLTKSVRSDVKDTFEYF